MEEMHKLILPKEWSLQLSKNGGHLVHDVLKFLVRKVSAHLVLPDGQHAPLDENTKNFDGLDSFYTINLRGDEQVLSFIFICITCASVTHN